MADIRAMVLRAMRKSQSQFSQSCSSQITCGQSGPFNSTQLDQLHQELASSSSRFSFHFFPEQDAES